MTQPTPFPRRSLAPSNAPTRDGQPLTHCDDPAHVFATIPGRCQCGEHLWTEKPEPDVTFHHEGST